MAESDIQNILVQMACSSATLANDGAGPGGDTLPEIQREPYWTNLEKEILIEETGKRLNILDSKFSGSQRGNSIKTRAWQEIVNAINSKGTVKIRTIKQAKKQYSNLKERAKKSLSQNKYPKTGGGPKPPSPSPMDEAVIQQMEGRPSLRGLDNGFDSALLSESDVTSIGLLGSQDPILSASPVTVIAETHAEPMPSTCAPIISTQEMSSNRKCVKRKNLQDSLDFEQLEVLKLEKEKLQMEIECLKIKKEKLREELNFYKIQTSLIQNKSS